MVTWLQVLVPAIGAAAGWYLLKGKKRFGNLSGTEALIVGAVVGGVAQAVMVTPPFGLYQGRLRNSGAYAPLVVTGRQSSGSYVF